MIIFGILRSTNGAINFNVKLNTYETAQIAADHPGWT